jgi:rhodanese-related sulfurtransferase
LAELRKSDESIRLIDVRTPVEFREVHVEFAENVPLDRLDSGEVARSRNGSSDQPLYVICRSGNRAKQACEKLDAAGISVVNVEGGTQAWDAAGWRLLRKSDAPGACPPGLNDL